MLDSGASHLLINKRVTEALGLKFTHRDQAFGVGKGPVETFLTDEALVEVGQLRSFRKQMSALALDTLKRTSVAKWRA